MNFTFGATIITQQTANNVAQTFDNGNKGQFNSTSIKFLNACDTFLELQRGLNTVQQVFLHYISYQLVFARKIDISISSCRACHNGARNTIACLNGARNTISCHNGAINTIYHAIMVLETQYHAIMMLEI